MLGRRLILGDDDAAVAFDRLHTIRAVPPVTSQHDPDRASAE